MDCFIEHILLDQYRAIVLVRPLEGTFDAETRESVKDCINRHASIIFSDVYKYGDIEMECDLFLILNVTCKGPSVIHLIDFFGDLPGKEVGINVIGGWETHYGLFDSEEQFEKCKKFLGRTYKIDSKRSKYSEKPGLQLNPPLRLERITFGLKPFTKYREGIDKSLRKSRIPSETQNNWLDVLYTHGSESLEWLKRKLGEIPMEAKILFTKVLLWLATKHEFDP